jgi:prevent-host-death family protein
MQIAAGQFKAQCLQLMDQVQQSREEIVITKHGKPVAKLVPVDESEPRSILGYLQGTVEIVGDIVSPLEDEWEANR